MSVKRRLFISNMLMIIIPPLLTIIVGAAIILTSASILGIRDTKEFRAFNDLNNAVSQVYRLTRNWEMSEPQKISEDVAAFCENYSQKNITLTIFQDGEIFCSTGDISDEPLIQMLLQKPGDQSIFMDDTTLYKIDAGAYTILLEGSGRGIPFNSRAPQGVFVFGIIAFAVMFIVILATNRLLTKMVYKSIAVPLDMLEHGVHQLRDGNLEYRIGYSGKDEFAGVCSAFNDMAGRLLDMVNARQKDDENRRELIAGISHDLRTPLTSIISYVEGLEQGIAKTPDTQKRYLDTIKQKAMDLEHTVSQLFLFSKLDVGEFPLQLAKLDIGKEISGFVTSISDEYKEKGLRVAAGILPPDIFIRADVVQLRSAFTNILDNSLKYGRQENGKIIIDCRADGQNAIVTLTDNGPGVPADALENLFTTFYRSDKARSNPGQGSGLGLAITAKILEQLGGSIRAENVVEGGLRVIMQFSIITEDSGDEKDIDR